MNEYNLKIYVKDNGKEPVIEWLKTLDSTARKRILLRFDRLKDGNFGDFKQIDEELFELRFTFGSGYREFIIPLKMMSLFY